MEMLSNGYTYSRNDHSACSRMGILGLIVLVHQHKLDITEESKRNQQSSEVAFIFTNTAPLNSGACSVSKRYYKNMNLILAISAIKVDCKGDSFYTDLS